MRSGTAVAFILALAGSVAAQPAGPGQPVGQPDVVFVPTPQPVVDVMLRLAALSSDDLLYDLGSGDGRIVITAAKEYGSRGVGIDIDPARISESRTNAAEAGVTDRVKFVRADLFETDLRPATAVTLYLLNYLNLRLRPKILDELRPGTPVISHDFDMGEWRPDKTVEVGTSRVHLWHVPADLDGHWRVTLSDANTEREGIFEIEQAFQYFNGSAQIDHSLALEVSGRLAGAQVELSLGPIGGKPDQTLTGRVNGDAIEGTIFASGTGETAGAWSARRIPDVMDGAIRQ